jgi:hypothetical protein
MVGTGEKVRNASVVIGILYRILLRLLIQGTDTACLITRTSGGLF